MITRFATLICLLLLLAACSGAPDVEVRPTPIDPGGGEGGGSAEEGGGVGQSLALRLWAPEDPARNTAYATIIAAYTAANPGVAIQLETFDPATYRQMLQTAQTAGTAADIVQIEGTPCPLAAGGYLGEVPAAVLSLSDAPARLFPAALGGHVCGDQLYGVPQTVNLPYGAALVNATAAGAIGRGDITGWADWEALVADARALTLAQDGVMSRTGFHFIGGEALPAMFYSLILQNGGQFMTNGTITANTPQGMAALAQMKRFVDEGIIDPQRFNDAADPIVQSFSEGRSGIIVAGPSVAVDWSTRYPQTPTTYWPLPAAGTPALAGLPGWGLAVSRTSTAQEVAWDFVRFAVLDPANAATFNLAAGALPALRANAEGDAVAQLAAARPALATLLPLLPLAQSASLGPDHDRLWREVTYPLLLAHLQGAAGAEETLAALDSAARATQP